MTDKTSGARQAFGHVAPKLAEVTDDHHTAGSNT